MIQGRVSKALIALTALLSASVALGAPESVPGEYIVKLKTQPPSVDVQDLSQLLNNHVVSYITPQSNAVLVSRPMVEVAEVAMQNIAANPNVERVEPNYIYRINRMPNDPKFDELWGLLNSAAEGIDVDALRAWDITTGSRDIVVAVIDTGVGHSLPDLAPNMWMNKGEVAGNGVDDDGNGYVDDIYGYDFANTDADPMDDHGHGSHCSGTIGAKGNDGYGLTGVAWDVQIMALKFLTGSGSGTLEGAIKSIDYATANGAHIMSNSWGGGGFSETLVESIQRAEKAGILFVAAAGNSGNDSDTSPLYPAAYDVDNIISVAALQSDGILASFSNYGAVTVDVAAPGKDILSITPDGYKSWSGTSMATPHVSGIAALVLSNEPELEMADLRERIIRTAKPLYRLKNKVMSGGLASAYHAVSNTMPGPDPRDPSGWANQKSANESTAHPYADNASETFTFTAEGATRMALYFDRFETEAGFDKATFYDAAGEVVGVWSGNNDAQYSPIVNGDTMTVVFTSDGSVNKYGFDVTSIAFE